MSEEYFKGESVSINYFPRDDKYLIEVKSSLHGERSFPIDQRMLEQFSKGTIEDLSDDFATLGWGSEISRPDLERIHSATIQAMDKYDKGFEQFKESNNL